jgi:hypothetical protein
MLAMPRLTARLALRVAVAVAWGTRQASWCPYGYKNSKFAWRKVVQDTMAGIWMAAGRCSRPKPGIIVGSSTWLSSVSLQVSAAWWTATLLLRKTGQLAACAAASVVRCVPGCLVVACCPYKVGCCSVEDVYQSDASNLLIS